MDNFIPPQHDYTTKYIMCLAISTATFLFGFIIGFFVGKEKQ